MKYYLYALLLIGVFVACKNDAPAKKVKNVDATVLDGKTMGTYYRVTYLSDEQFDLQGSIDSLLKVINLEVSTYIDHSTISMFNKSAKAVSLSYNPITKGNGGYENKHFLANFVKAREIYNKSKQFFDPTVMPLVNYWGFGYTEKKPVTAVDSMKIDSLIQLVGLDKVSMIRSDAGGNILKLKEGVQLDFSAIAKGYAVDEVGNLLIKNGVSDFLVDIGGEVLAKGNSPRGDEWVVGINKPKEGAAMNDVQTVVPIQNRAIATSGNYRNFYEVDGVKYSHTINPITGFPERNTLLSASVFADDCTTADAYATAFMVMGKDRALQLAAADPTIDAYFIYSDDKGEMKFAYTDGVKSIFEK
jgi:thiamine biosynthesis lipoprotein